MMGTIGEEMGSVVETGSAELSVFPSCLRPMRSMPFIVDEVRNVWSGGE